MLSLKISASKRELEPNLRGEGNAYGGAGAEEIAERSRREE